MRMSTQCVFILLLAIQTSTCLKRISESYSAYQREKDLFPKSFSQCVDTITNSSLPKHVIQAIQSHCLDRFISVDQNRNWAKRFTSDEQNYIKSLFRKVIVDASESTNRHGRQKRDTRLFSPRRVRYEIRASDKQWNDFANNVRRLKYDVIAPNGRSKYDIIADIHVTAINSSHFGPNFVGWHRLYLIILESALGVVIPYWDSTYDFEMQDPTQSILWSKKFFGNGFGMVKTGPFANFQTPVGPLFRNIASDGCLFMNNGVQNILKQCRLREISDPYADMGMSLEGQHNSVHNWVDGQMNNIEASPHDPLFFNHHAFVDYIWELFRTKQKTLGIDPTKDTFIPPANLTFQNISDPAVGLTGFYNVDGYSERIASMIHFVPRPVCPQCGPSPYLFCDKIKQVCVSTRRNPMEYWGRQEEAMPTAMTYGLNSGGSRSHPFPLYERDERSRMDSVTMNYNRNGNNNGQSNNNQGRPTNAGTSTSRNGNQGRYRNGGFETLRHDIPGRLGIGGFNPFGRGNPVAFRNSAFGPNVNNAINGPVALDLGPASILNQIEPLIDNHFRGVPVDSFPPNPSFPRFPFQSVQFEERNPHPNILRAEWNAEAPQGRNFGYFNTGNIFETNGFSVAPSPFYQFERAFNVLLQNRGPYK